MVDGEDDGTLVGMEANCTILAVNAGVVEMSL